MEALVRNLMGAVPAWIIGTAVVGLSAAFGVFGIRAVRRGRQSVVFRRNNELASVKFNVIGVIYGLIMAMAIVAVWDNFSRVREITQLEANRLGDLAHASHGLDAEIQTKVMAELRAYRHYAVNEEWKLMINGERSARVEEAVNKLNDLYASTNTRTVTQQEYLGRSIGLLSELMDARRSRLNRAVEGMPGIIWAVLIVGSLVTIGFTFFFGSEDARTQEIMVAIFAATIGLALFAILELDHPYEGSVRVSPVPLLNVRALN